MILFSFRDLIKPEEAQEQGDKWKNLLFHKQLGIMFENTQTVRSIGRVIKSNLASVL